MKYLIVSFKKSLVDEESILVRISMAFSQREVLNQSTEDNKPFIRHVGTRSRRIAGHVIVGMDTSPTLVR